MDIGLFVALMLVVYVVPEILKRMKKRKPYSYPPVPIPSPPEAPNSIPPGIPGELSAGIKIPGFSTAYPMSGQGSAGDEGDPEWEQRKELLFIEETRDPLCGFGELNISPREAVQGIVWAEIISPPLAKRQSRN